MKIEIYDGRTRFYQWDLDCRVLVNDPAITHVHFSNTSSSYAYVCAVYEYEGKTVADVPNILLQATFDIVAFGYAGDHTVSKSIFQVIDRVKPENYIYTETDVIDLISLDIRKLDKAGYTPDRFLGTDAYGTVIEKEINLDNKIDYFGHSPNKFLGINEQGIVVDKEIDFDVSDKLDKSGHEPNKMLVTNSVGNIGYDSLKRYHYGPTPPEDKTLIWIDPTDGGDN